VTIGGIDLGVSRYSRFPQQAFEAAACLRNSANQKIDATVGGLPPTIISLYQDPEVRASYPFADIALSELQNASVRPQTPAYVNLSLTVQADLSPPSSINPPSTVNKLRTDIRNAINDKGLIP
jgi:multiple sugar transport system substrate-binding protein